MADSRVMADSAFDDALSRVLEDVKYCLKEEQRAALRQLFYGHDVLAILPTGFGKSLIFQLLVLLKSKSTLLVICPLRSIVEDQLKEVCDFGIKATSLPEASLEELKKGSYQILYSSPECALEKEFLDQVLKEGHFHDNMAAVERARAFAPVNLLMVDADWLIFEGVF